MPNLYIIEARDAQGQLKFGCPQPNEFFGLGAIQGMDEDEMAQAIFRKIPDASLKGSDIPNWPRMIHRNWIARRKTW